MKTGPTKASLTFEFELIEPTEEMLAGICDECGEHHEDASDLLAMRCDVKIRAGDYTEDDIMPKMPATFVKQGLLMAFMEALMNGLHSERGTNFKYATEAAQEKFSEAVRLDGKLDVYGELRKLLEGSSIGKKSELESMEIKGSC